MPIYLPPLHAVDEICSCETDLLSPFEVFSRERFSHQTGRLQQRPIPGASFPESDRSTFSQFFPSFLVPINYHNVDHKSTSRTTHFIAPDSPAERVRTRDRNCATMRSVRIAREPLLQKRDRFTKTDPRNEMREHSSFRKRKEKRH